MDAKYFERLDRDEARYAEWRSLDAALTGRMHDTAGWQRLRVAVGHALIAVGARLAGESEAHATRATVRCEPGCVS